MAAGHRGDHPRHRARQVVARGSLRSRARAGGACSSDRGKKDDLARVRKPTRAGAVLVGAAEGAARPRARGAAARGRRSATSRSRCCSATICSTPKRPRHRPAHRRLRAARRPGVIALKEVPAGQEHMYGIVDGERDGARGLNDQQAGREAGARARASSRAAIDRALRAAAGDLRRSSSRHAAGRGGEIQLTDALATLCARRGLYGLEVEGERFDAGDAPATWWRCSTTRSSATTSRDDVRAGIEKLLAEVSGRREVPGALLEVAVGAAGAGDRSPTAIRVRARRAVGRAGGGAVRRRARSTGFVVGRAAARREADVAPRDIEEVVGGRAGLRRGDDRASAGGSPTTTRRRSARCCARRCRRGSRRAPSARCG